MENCQKNGTFKDMDEVADWTERRCLSLILEIDHESGKTALAVYSGFVIEFKGEWLWMTAAHVLDEVDILIARNQIKRAVFQPAVDGESPVPFRLTLLQSLKVTAFKFDADEDPDGSIAEYTARCDIGFIHLPSPFPEYLSERGTVAFTESDCIADKNFKITPVNQDTVGVLVVGTPAANTDVADGVLSATNVRLPLQRYGNGEDRLPEFKFAPGWKREEFNHDVKGLSGSPIVLHIDGTAKLVGVQSSNFPGSGRFPQWIKVIAADAFLRSLKVTVTKWKQDPTMKEFLEGPDVRPPLDLMTLEELESKS